MYALCTPSVRLKYALCTPYVRLMYALSTPHVRLKYALCTPYVRLRVGRAVDGPFPEGSERGDSSDFLTLVTAR